MPPRHVVRTWAMMIALAMVASPIASAHEAKDYTILLKSDGATPSQVPSGVLVTTDRLFFMMVDPGENKSQRILVDTDGDGNFLGTDDISSPWLTSSCSLDEGGTRRTPIVPSPSPRDGSFQRPSPWHGPVPNPTHEWYTVSEQHHVLRILL